MISYFPYFYSPCFDWNFYETFSSVSYSEVSMSFIIFISEFKSFDFVKGKRWKNEFLLLSTLNFSIDFVIFSSCIFYVRTLQSFRLSRSLHFPLLKRKTRVLRSFFLITVIKWKLCKWKSYFSISQEVIQFTKAVS